MFTFLSRTAYGVWHGVDCRHFLAAAAVPEAQAAPRQLGSSVRATATVTVRLLESATIRFDRSIETNAFVRDRILRLADGDHHAKIVEFE